MRRLAVLALIVVLVAAPILAVELTGSVRAQDPLPTPEGQLGGAPSLTTRAPVQAEATSERTPSPEPTCAGAVAIDIHQGPSAGRSFLGVVSLAVEPSGLIEEAAIVTTAGERFAVVGQATGRAINLMVELRDGQYLFAVGTLERVIAECQGLAGGSFVGPQPGDTGEWRACLGTGLPEALVTPEVDATAQTRLVTAICG